MAAFCTGLECRNTGVANRPVFPGTSYQNTVTDRYIHWGEGCYSRGDLGNGTPPVGSRDEALERNLGAKLKQFGDIVYIF